MSDRTVIAFVTCTPMGALQGELASLTALQLGVAAIYVVVKHTGLRPEQIEEVITGCVLPAGQGQTLARQVVSDAGLPLSVGYTAANKTYGSGMRAAVNVYDALLAGSVDVVVAGDMESMTNVPHLILKGRGGYRIGHGMIYDHAMLDDLEDAYDKGRTMDTLGEDCAEKYGPMRKVQNHFVMTSVRRAQEATEPGTFHWEITPVTVSSKVGDTVIDTDEDPCRIKTDKVPSFKPAFKRDDTMTAASPSSINDGAAALMMTRESIIKQLGITSLAVILGHITHTQTSGWFATAPAIAIDRLFKKLNWNSGNIDLFKVNEVFAVVPMAVMHDLHIPHERANVNGGACTLGHPTDTSDARVTATLLSALQYHDGKRGVTGLCIGGGEVMIVGIELY